MEDIELLTDYAGYLEQKKSEGKKIIAFIAHDNMPEELIHAGGFIPMRLIFAGNDDLMNISHEYLPPSTCCFAQTCIGLFKLELSRYRFLKLIDYFVVSNHCVSDICTSEIITKFFNIPRLNFYISYTASEYSQKYFNLALTDFKKQLEEIKGGVISNTELFESIKIYNEFKIKLSKLNKVLHDDKQKLKIFQKALLYGPEISSELDTLLESSKNTENKPQENKKDIILTGCALFIGDDLINLINNSGGHIIHFDTWIGEQYFSQIFEEQELNSSSNPFDLLIERFKKNTCNDHQVPNFLENRIARIEQLHAMHFKKTGREPIVINHVLKFCDHISIFQNFLKEKLQEKGIKVLNIERDYSGSNKGQLSTRIEAFLEMS